MYRKVTTVAILTISEQSAGCIFRVVLRTHCTNIQGTLKYILPPSLQYQENHIAFIVRIF
jgi:hypothetical protein